MSDEVLRRNDMAKWTLAEQAIWNAISEVGKLPADARTTEALRYLQNARHLMHDYYDAACEAEDKQPVLMLHNIQLMTESAMASGAKDRALHLIDVLRHELRETFARSSKS